MRRNHIAWLPAVVSAIGLMVLSVPVAALEIEVVEVEGQPLASNVSRLLQALEFLGSPLPAKTTEALRTAAKKRDAIALQKALDPHVLFVVRINPESRVKVGRGPADPILQQGGFTPVIVKVVNDSTVKKVLRIRSPQAGPIFSGGRAGNVRADQQRFLDVEMFTKRPMTENLSGLGVEYAIALIHSSEAGQREAIIGFDVGQGTQDLGFRGEVPVLFQIRPAIPVKLVVKDFDGKPTVGRFTFRHAGRVYPPKAKRLAPDFFFQDQIYRPDGGTVLLPPGQFDMEYGRGPEYVLQRRTVTVPENGPCTIEVHLKRWINPMDYGFYSGDHHIHAAGCAHYTNPTEGVFAKDMFLHVKGEGLNVGCNLTWGPCFEFQRQFFEPKPHRLSEPFTVLKYDIEVSGFGSQALGHVCLLNLRDQDYPGSDGTKTKGWPTWTTPLMKWAKAQGAYCGYAHSANGLGVNPRALAQRTLNELDKNRDGRISRQEVGGRLLPDRFERLDRNRDGSITRPELVAGIQRVRNQLPNYAIPEMNGIGAQEICVTTAQGLCDFISAMDTQRVPEWNCWYHILNCGYPLKVSGETDFPCISGSRVGEGRVYVHLGKIDRIDFGEWCAGLAAGRSYVSDGYAHALEFTVNGKSPGYGDVKVDAPTTVTVRAKVAFASELPLGTAKGARAPLGKTRTVEIVVNGKAVASKIVPADNRVHELTFSVPIERSSWVALRHFPQLHTNPVNVIVGGKPIRASRKSALWCIGTIEQLWRVRGPGIAAHERDEAKKTFDWAIEQYRRIARECPEGT